MFDRDNTGKIDQNEFHQLWNYLGQWRQIFNQYDADFSGNISQQELGSALQQMGYRLFEGRNFRIKIFIFQIFPSIYSVTLSKVWFQSRWKSPVWWFCTFHYNDSGRGPTVGLLFGARIWFLLKRLTGAFQQYDVHRNGNAQFTYEQYLSSVIGSI